MRGRETPQTNLFSYVNLDSRIPAKHPIRKLRQVVDVILATLDKELSARYAEQRGRPSIPPECLLRALLLQAMYSIRSERQLVEQLDYNLMFRWFVGLGMDDKVWDRTTFCANRDRILDEGLLRLFFNKVVTFARWCELVSDDHFSVDGSMIEAWASHKSFVRKGAADKDDNDPGAGPDGRNTDVDFKGEVRSNKTHESTTDPSARLYKKAQYAEAKLRHLTHIISENRHGLVVDVETTQATGTSEREAAETMAQRSLNKGNTLGADKAYDVADHIQALKQRGIKSHAAAKKSGSAMNPRTVRSKAHAVSQRKRKLVEQCFGWAKTVGGFRKTRFIGTAKVQAQALLTFAAYNLTRMMTLFGWREAFLQAQSACRA